MRRMFDEKEIKALGTEGAVAEIAGGNVENAKPIYFHPIWVRDNVNNISQFTMIILDNSSTTYNWTRIVAFLNSLPRGSRLNCNGTLIYSGAVYALSCIEQEAENTFFFRATKLSDGSLATISLGEISYSPTNVEDGVNKIN